MVVEVPVAGGLGGLAAYADHTARYLNYSRDTTKCTWNIKWLNALAGTWVDLGPEELGGVTFDGQSIIYAFKEPVAGHAYTRATYTNISEKHFTW